MTRTTKEHLLKIIEKRENNLKKLLSEIQEIEKKIPLTMRENINGFKRVQRLKETILQPKTRAEQEFNKNKNFRSNCLKFLLNAIKDIYVEKHKSQENIKEFLGNDNHKKDILEQLRVVCEQRIENKSKDNNRKKPQQQKQQKAIRKYDGGDSNTKLRPRASVIYQKRMRPKLLPTSVKQQMSISTLGATTSTETVDINFPQLKYNFFNKDSLRLKESDIELEAKPKSTKITSNESFEKWRSLDKYRVKPSRLRPKRLARNSFMAIMKAPSVYEENKSSSSIPCEDQNNDNNNKSNLQHYYSLFDNIFYNQIQTSRENQYVQKRREQLTENIKDAIMLGHSKDTRYSKKIDNTLKNLVQLVNE